MTERARLIRALFVVIAVAVTVAVVEPQSVALWGVVAGMALLLAAAWAYADHVRKRDD